MAVDGQNMVSCLIDNGTLTSCSKMWKHWFILDIVLYKEVFLCVQVLTTFV